MNNTFMTEEIFVRSKPSRRSLISNIEFPVYTEKRSKRNVSSCELAETDIEEIMPTEKPKSKKLKQVVKQSLSRFASAKSKSKSLTRKLSWRMKSKSKIREILAPANAPKVTNKKVILGDNEEEVDDIVIWEEKYSQSKFKTIAFL